MTFPDLGDKTLKEVESACQSHTKPNNKRQAEVTATAHIVTPVHKIMTGAELDRIMDELDREFGDTFRALAK